MIKTYNFSKINNCTIIINNIVQVWDSSSSSSIIIIANLIFLVGQARPSQTRPGYLYFVFLTFFFNIFDWPCLYFFFVSLSLSLSWGGGTLNTLNNSDIFSFSSCFWDIFIVNRGLFCMYVCVHVVVANKCFTSLCIKSM